MRRYTSPGTYNYTWQEMNARHELRRERESFVENSLDKVWNMDRGTGIYALEEGMSAVQHSDTREEIGL